MIRRIWPFFFFVAGRDLQDHSRWRWSGYGASIFGLHYNISKQSCRQKCMCTTFSGTIISLSIWFCAINFLDDFSHLGQVLPSKCGKVSGHIRISTCKIVSLTHIYKCFICQAYFLPFCSVGFHFELLSRNVTKANVKIKSIITQQYVLAQVYYWTYQIGPPVF